MVNKKRCYTCKDTKPLSYFHKDRTKDDGHSGRCKSCVSKYEAAHYAENKEAILKRQRRYRRDKIARGICHSCQEPQFLNAGQYCLHHNIYIRLRFDNLHHHYDYGDILALWTKQGGHCIFCNHNDFITSHIDHDHITKEVRGILCQRHNQIAIGGLDMLSNEGQLISALAYLAEEPFDADD